MEAWFTNFFNSIQFEMLIRMILSAILGGIVGMERGSGDRPAGFRTHILVCAGSTLITLVSMYGFDGFDQVPFEYPRNRDSARIAAQVVSGIGFLGAGTILHEGLTVRGLTTAASLWMVSAIGLAAGAGMYFISIMATAITMITLVTFHTWEKRFSVGRSPDRKFIRITAVNSPGLITNVTNYLTENKIKVKTINVKNNPTKKQIVLELYLKFSPEQDATDLTMGIQQIDGILTIENVG
jgi:putative Mg2+ transporter-C (MgtC) family protein